MTTSARQRSAGGAGRIHRPRWRSLQGGPGRGAERAITSELGASRRLPMTLGICGHAHAAEGSGSGSNPTVRAAETRSSHFPTRTRAAQICGKGGIETERERLLLEVALEVALEWVTPRNGRNCTLSRVAKTELASRKGLALSPGERTWRETKVFRHALRRDETDQNRRVSRASP